jgi:hypothetical protein
MADVTKLFETLDAILAHPEMHDQRNWATQTECGTTYCFAGWRAVLDGYTEMDWVGWRENVAGYARKPDTERWVDIPNHAARSLDLTPNQVEALFYFSGTLADVKDTVDRIAAGEI